MRRTLLAAALSFMTGPAFAASFSVPLPVLVGEIGYPIAIETSFDFGQQFFAIENVYLEIEARVSALQFDSCGTFFDPQPCVHEVFLLGFSALLDKEDTPALGVIFSEGLSFSDNPRDLEGAGVDLGVFRKRLGFDFLLDGKGSLTLYWNGISGDPDEIVQNVIQPSGEIFNARLIIEGTPVPEPSTALLVAAGLTVLAVTKPRNGCVIVVYPHRK